jgi:hypothetical protein
MPRTIFSGKKEHLLTAELFLFFVPKQNNNIFGGAGKGTALSFAGLACRLFSQT